MFGCWCRLQIGFTWLVILVLAMPAEAASPLLNTKLIVSVTGCPEHGYFHPEYGWRGNRAVVAPDGSAFVLQCADGHVHSFRARAVRTRDLGDPTLFAAAQAEGLLPNDLTCDWGPVYSSLRPADCDVLDQAGDYALLNQPLTRIMRRKQPKMLAEMSPSDTAGVLYPRSIPDRVIIADSGLHPGFLRTMTLSGHPKDRSIGRLPRRGLVFEDGEGSPLRLIYAAAPDLILVAFDGVFRVSNRMTLVAAYTPAGEERWKVSGSLPPRTPDNLIVGDGADLQIMSHGKFAAVQRRAQRDVIQIIDTADGKTVDSLTGQLVAASPGGLRLLVRTSDQRVDLLEWAPSRSLHPQAATSSAVLPGADFR